MPFRFGDIWKRYSAVGGNWRLPGEPAFAKSRAFELLSRDLRRYVLEEVAGRSFLIAGHRGAGKTSTVVHAVRQLRRELITASVDPVGIPTGRRGRLQRPMIVKLVGEAILAAPPRQKEVEQAVGEQAKEDAEAGGDGAGANGRDPADPGPAADGRDPVGNALVHITIALYRSLAAEVAEAFTFHCLDGDERDRPDRLELAAQLALELDGTPEPAMLRAYWDRIGRLQGGILWPRDSDRAISDSAIRDQGLKEVVAITTAAQAFQVCSGAVTYEVGREQSDKTETKTESTVDVKELANRLGALGAGALAGSVVGVGSGAAEGVGIGLLVWLASGLALSWTSSRERKASRTLNYQFIQDRSVQTLDRDLPVVIDRIRQAGLAPVFVIDELDKLTEEKPGEKIAEIIHRLKHLVADYGFFCFLANRDYFDLIERKVADEPYPTEHTYFSERVLVLSRPEDLYDYLIGLLADVPEEGPGALRAAVFALVVMFRSKLNFSDVAREVATLTGSNDELICTDEELQSAGRYRLAATIQIAIDRVLSADEVKERMELDSGFAQLAIDALYYIARAWESDAEECVDIRPRALRDDLLKRMNAAPAPVPDPLPPGDFPGAGEDCAISPPDLREISCMVARLALYLANFAMLQTELESEAGLPTTKPADATLLKRLVDIVITERGSLLRPAAPGETSRYCFALNELARPVTTPPLVPPPPPPLPPTPQPPPSPAPAPSPPPPQPVTRTRRRSSAPKAGARDKSAALAPEDPAPPAVTAESTSPPPVPPLPAPDQQLDQVAALFDAVDLLLSTFELSVDDLVLAGLLPSTISQSLLVGGRGDLTMARANPTHSEARDKVINAYLALFQALNDRGNEVAQALVRLAVARHQSGKKEPASKILARLSRYFESSGPFIIPSPLRATVDWVSLSGKAESIRAFVSEFKRWQKQLAKLPVWMPEELVNIELWAPWQGDVAKFLLQNQTAAPAAVSLDTIVSAAADLPPGNLFRLRLSRMDSGDWSRVALAGVPYPGRIVPTPAWPIFAGLAALKFNSGFLTGLFNGSRAELTGKDWSSDEQEFIERILALTSFAPPALVAVLPDQPSRRFLPVSLNQPILGVGASEFQSCLPALNWLAERGAFLGGVREIEEGKTSGADLQPSGKLAELVWAKTSRKAPASEKAAHAGDIVYNVETPEDFIRAFLQQQTKASSPS